MVFVLVFGWFQVQAGKGINISARTFHLSPGDLLKVRAYTHAHAHTRNHTHPHTYNINIHMCINGHANIHEQIDTQTHTLIHVCMQKHTQINQILPYNSNL